MDKETRNLIFNTTQAVRRLLAEEFALQLEGTFDVQRDGQVAAQSGAQLTPAERLVRQRIVDAIMHRRAGAESDLDSVRGFQSEAVFTLVNRLAALKMMEARGLVLPCVSAGDQSQGFREFSGLAPGLIELPDKGYRLYLECIFDEIGREVGVLFDRTDAASLLWARRNALESALEKINNSELKHVWAEDETIGWIYQYYNDPEERKQMRDESAAPRNSRELAVRNQFFTPRYVVQFLTDNTLGRTWYEMCGGRTVLKEKCRYMVRRPNEIFLKAGEALTENSELKTENLSQEELLRQPVFIPHRLLKDPRTILMLDPACGSMHFGLYAFDLFEVIYREAWEFEEEFGADTFIRPPGMKPLREAFATKEEFLRQVPRLIIEHNIHGIDIDPRAAQIAGLALWLRAQRAWKNMGIAPAQRPAIRRSNIVCAEPMPGEKELLREFVTQKFPVAEQPVFQKLLEVVFEKMKLAGEAGSLLKIDEEIRSAIEESKKLWKSGPKLEQSNLFGEPGPAKQKELTIDLSGITDEEFWNTVEGRIYTALRDYAEEAENGGGFQRRLFAEDAARGFAFIDLLRKRYDVILMNPPFGDAAESSKVYIFAEHDREKTEVAACFVTRTLAILEASGSIGIISNRTFLFAESFQAWKSTNLSGLSHCADLGFGVLDAMVETAAFVLSTRPLPQSTFVALTNSREKGEDLVQAVMQLADAAKPNPRVFTRSRALLKTLGNPWFYYWISEAILGKADTLAASKTGLIARRGLQTCDNFRFLRLAWEIPRKSDVSSQWFRLSKGGDYQPFWSDLYLLVFWRDDGAEAKAVIEASYDSWSKQIPSVDLYHTPGLTYTERTSSSLSMRTLPAQCLFDKQGPFVGYRDFVANRRKLLMLLGVSYTYYARALVDSQIGLRDATSAGSPARHYMPAAIENLPLLSLSPEEEDCIEKWVTLSIRFHQQIGELDVTDSLYMAHPALRSHASILEVQAHLGSTMVRSAMDVYTGLEYAEKRVASALALTPEAQAQLEGIFGPRLENCDDSQAQVESEELSRILAMSEGDLVKETLSKVGLHSSVLKPSFVGIRKIELAALALKASPHRLLEAVANFEWLVPITDLCQLLCDEWIGFLVGRWDIRYATGEQATPELPDPFAALPVCPPGLLQNAQGLPARPEDVPADYPIKNIPWDGILVDDPNHPLDIERRVSDVIGFIWSDRAEAIEQEACEILGVNSLRDYFRKPAGFFADHLSRYSKSRRQAPIYWPLSSPNNNYTVWLYYHRLNADTLFTVLRDHVKPKLEYEERRAFEIRQDAGPSPSTFQIRDIAEAEELVEDLRAFKAELEKVAPLFRPNLNDGVIINYAPLWRLIGLPKWRKDCQSVWNELAQGDFDWAHLAINLWPERVIPKCAKDRSLAIAHGLGDFFWEEILGEEVDSSKPATKKKTEAAKMTPPLGELAPETAAPASTTVTADPATNLVGTGKWRPKKVPAAEVAKLIAERTSPAVKAALESLLGSSSGEANSIKKRKGKKA